MTSPLDTYLNDHHAGASAAVALLDRLIEAHPDLRAFLSSLRADIAADRDELRGIMRRLDVQESKTKEWSGWFSEKLVSLKLAFDGDDNAFKLMEALEALSLGILGKYKLWTALAQQAAAIPVLATVDLKRLEARALSQHDRVEHERLAAGREALRVRIAG